MLLKTLVYQGFKFVLIGIVAVLHAAQHFCFHKKIFSYLLFIYAEQTQWAPSLYMVAC